MARRRSENVISFFSFQDIMMSVCGIVILVTLLLVLKLVAQTAEATPDSTAMVSAEEVRDIQEQMESLEQLRRDIQDQIVELQRIRAQGAEVPWVPSQEQIDSLQRQLARLKAETKELESKLDSAKKKTEEFQKRQDAVYVQEKERILNELRQLIEELDKSNRDLAEKLTELRRKVQEAKNRNAELDRSIAETSEVSKKVFFTKKQTTDKTPYIVIYDSKAITVLTFTKSKAATFSSDEKFLDWAQRRNTRTEYFVLYLRPSQIRNHEKMIKALRSKGFDVGFDLLGETTDFALQTE